MRRNAVGLRELLFQSVTAMAPAARVAASIPSGAAFTAFAAGSLPLSVLSHSRELLKPLRHLLVPLLGIVAFVPALFTTAGLPAFDVVTEPTPPVSYAGPVVGVWMAAGIVVLLALLRRHPERIAETARAHLDETVSTGHPQNGAVQP
ncbi:hypothetical protein [Streptomyces sp. MBT65]|uniref:hypothetical protein n=1 Tax=Streptomyces sp. MBT65 TaxID=1488395 RepID=UPI001F433693|nr:hypothetical protein [Streptomyces sp. MBT65]